ncbi:MAG: hypothetical protein K9G64_08635 [Bacteroidia bacterium]|nr:hypothetical protein [Bacteroidia bacterium]
MKNNNTTIITIATILTISSCSKEDPKKPIITNPQEVLTTILIKGHNQNDSLNTNYQFNYKWEDLDGDGGNLPVIDTINLDSGIIYTCEIIILDKTKTPFDTVSNAIEEEKNSHQFFFAPNANLTDKIKAEILDFDTNIPSLPVGLSFNLNTKSNQSYALPLLGTLNIVLSHYDGVPKTIEKSSESDIDINFPIKLK